ncbi:MAG: GNAT family N-acetyltransferase [Mariniblastus sp.]
MISQAGEISPVTSRIDSKPRVPTAAVLAIDVIHPQELCGEIAEQWVRLRNQSGLHDSPYFDIEFVRAVGRVRNDVEVALARNESGEIVCFMPYQRISAHHAEPVGGRLNDVHGILGNLANQSELLTLVMRKAKIYSFGFHAAINRDSGMEKFQFKELDSHYLDIGNGWEEYRKWVRKHSSTVRRQGQKTRALEREVGPIRFEFDCADASVLERLIEMKRAKYQRSNTFDILSVQWAADLLREISNVDAPGFKGLLSALWAGDETIACHFGLLTDDILHYWFPIFDPQYSKYSPGTEILLQVTEHASELGVKKVDLGYGDDAYKFKFCNATEKVVCGRMTFNRLQFNLAKQRYHIRQKLKDIPMKPLAKSLLRGLFPGFGQWNFK